MPAQFDSFGIRFLYPDNWKVAQREEEEGDRGTTLELPSGGFVSIERTRAEEVDALIERIVETIAADYEDLEREPITLDVLPPEARALDLRFYYLDLLIISRLVVIELPESQASAGDAALADELPEVPAVPAVTSPPRDHVLVLQMQAESRDFDNNAPVFDAILKQIVPATP